MSTTEVRTLPLSTSETVEGAVATLVRNGSGVTMNIRTLGLEPGHVFTVWWLIFDEPGNCLVPYECTGADRGVEDNPSEAAVFGPAAGGLAGGTGRATFSGHTRPGQAATDVEFGDGSLDNPLGAEVHLVVRDHGPAIPGRIVEQMTTLRGGCDVNACRNVQVAVFRLEP